MKIKFLLIFLYVVLASNTNEKSTENITGNWRMCSQSSYGIIAHPNYCPTIVFYEDGTGTCEDEEPLPRFNWKIEKDSVFFSFETEHDKKGFISPHSRFSFEKYKNGKLEYLKILHGTSGRWYLLSR